MPRANRPRSARTHDQKIKQYTLWPEQQLDEKLRTVVLFKESAEVPIQEKATGAETASSFLRLVVSPKSPDAQEEQPGSGTFLMMLACFSALTDRFLWKESLLEKETNES